jgi:hypothetical protein
VVEVGKSFVHVAVLVLVLAPNGPTCGAQVDEKLQKKYEKADAQLIKACSELAKRYDADKSPEAAHFFASCAIAFGAKDDALASIKNSWEISVFIGKQHGGKLQTELEPIGTALRGLAVEYRGFRDVLWAASKQGNVSDASKKLLIDVGVKMEISQNAVEYVKTVLRFNALRQAMGLKAVLWDSGASLKLIPVAWYMAQTGDLYDQPGKEADQQHVCYSSDVEEARKTTTRIPNMELSACLDHLRHFGLSRQEILNPNARAIWLAHWSKGSTIPKVVLYSIPQLAYREDIPTPAARFKDETVVKKWDGWVDTEETIDVAGKKIPFVRYPYDGEPNAPSSCYSGEAGWHKDEYKFLEKAGVPIMCRFFVRTVPKQVEVQLSTASGRKLQTRTYLNGDARLRLQDWATILVVPAEALERGVKYSISMKCSLDGTDFEKTWRFTAGQE